MEKKQTGLTLVELMTTLAIAILLTAIGIPLFRSVTANNLAITQANTMVAALNLARSEAVKRATTVSVCSVADATVANPVCAGSTDWTKGWLVFVDQDPAGTDGTLDAGDTRIRVWDAFDPAPTITTSASYIQFSASGAANAATTWEMAQTHSKGAQTRCILVQSLGLVRAEKGACP